MAMQVATKIIDGDGHLNEDEAGIRAHSTQCIPGVRFARQALSAARSPALGTRRADSAAARRPAGRRTRRLAGVPRRRRDRVDRPLSDAALAYGKIVSLDYAVAICRAYNDWVYDTYLQARRALQGRWRSSRCRIRRKPPKSCAAPSPSSACWARCCPPTALPSRSARRPTGRSTKRRTGSAAASPCTAAATIASGWTTCNMYVPIARARPSVGPHDQLRQHRLQRHLRPLPQGADRVSRGRGRVAPAAPRAAARLARNPFPVHPAGRVRHYAKDRIRPNTSRTLIARRSLLPRHRDRGADDAVRDQGRRQHARSSTRRTSRTR